jgi:ribosomal protein S18 acetylase RimI-like enzyme
MLNFRTAITEKDVENVEKIVKSTDVFSELEIETAKELLLTQLANPNDTYQFLFIEENRKVVGYSCFGKIPLTEDNFDLYWIAVLKNEHKKGFGKVLLKETEKIVKNQNGRAIYIETASNPKYENTRNFYLRNDYIKIAEFPNFYKLGDAKIVYVKNILY